MSVYKLSKKFENAASDIDFLEKCASKGITPKGLRWNLQIQGLDAQTEDRVEKIKKDTEARVVDVLLKGMRQKMLRLAIEREIAMDKELSKRKGWEAIEWAEKVDSYRRKCKEEAEERKRKKMLGLLRMQTGGKTTDEAGNNDKNER